MSFCDFNLIYLIYNIELLYFNIKLEVLTISQTSCINCNYLTKAATVINLHVFFVVAQEIVVNNR